MKHKIAETKNSLLFLQPSSVWSKFFDVFQMFL